MDRLTFSVTQNSIRPTIFAALLDEDQGGRFQIEPCLTNARIRQQYLPDTNILLTRFLAEEGVSAPRDYIPIEQDATNQMSSSEHRSGHQMSGISCPTLGARRCPGIRLAHRLQESRGWSPLPHLDRSHFRHRI